MKPLVSVDDLGPPDLHAAVTTGTLPEFLSAYGESLILLVETPPKEAELIAGLASTAIAAGGGRLVAPVPDPLQYNTVILPHPQRVANTAPGIERDDPEALQRILGSGHHFAVPLRKRDEADAAFADRISVGRARNKDVVLRHGSVSKFHAWFEMDEAGTFRVTDGGSKNGTRVNGDRLAPREARAVGPGDAVRFGSVECLVCAPATLHRAVRTARSATG